MKRLLALFLAFFVSIAFAADPKEPFTPKPSPCVTLSVTNSSAATALAYPGGAGAVIYSAAGSALAFVEFCATSTCTATTAASYPIAASQKEALGLPPNTAYVAALTGASTATVYVCVGLGL